MSFKRFLLVALFLLLSFAVGSVAHGDDCCVLRGDVDDNGGVINIADLVYLVSYLFQGGPPPPCMEQADLNSDGEVNVADVTRFIDCIFIESQSEGSEKYPCFGPCS